MSRTIADVGSPAVAIRPDLLRTARITGVAYLGLAVTGLLGAAALFPGLLPDIRVDDDKADHSAVAATVCQRE